MVHVDSVHWTVEIVWCIVAMVTYYMYFQLFTVHSINLLFCTKVSKEYSNRVFIYISVLR